ncbi:MAG: peptidoglycan DD-metalloendopeptidase family protein, partial [Gammaproteobacteria bacterium]|nr:M23 family metallopeptidase [Gemmatimonadota bacterium]NIR35212.1 M23 family metallopeptidase [Actinomycetota bacterium]NIU73635.1 peptidoglycan DD-metalloendopeptidase family protein [Gammaproteobacteria bacterium]NIV86316.1 peptidoglycan DD-metalloendopeptidase family protein [Actinomycetota bacterium]NIX19670.1 peptidoglycan DD-metalloendopeptidase family protein [Actinomycetota bacterium]
GWESWYIHLNNDTPGTDDGRAGNGEIFGPGIEEGAFVRAGQVIGYVGDSGNAEGTHPHTHFELYQWGELVDPGPFLVDAFERGRIVAELLRLQS